jgi:hypothetical protein
MRFAESPKDAKIEVIGRKRQRIAKEISPAGREATSPFLQLRPSARVESEDKQFDVDDPNPAEKSSPSSAARRD